MIYINDLSRRVYAFWHCVLNDNASLCRRLQRTSVTMSEWRRQRSAYEDRENAAFEDLGFATLFLNRTNRSGIVGGGVIGGKNQNVSWPIEARLTALAREELVRRIRQIGRYRSCVRIL